MILFIATVSIHPIKRALGGRESHSTIRQKATQRNG